MVQINFDSGKLNDIFAEAAKKNEQPRIEYTKTAYLSEGKHTVRFFIDPDGNITREIAIHQHKGKKTLCPNWLNKRNATNPKWPSIVQAMCEEYADKKLTKLPECQICKIADSINDWRSGLSVRYQHIAYVNLYETDRPSEYWVPEKDNGTPYALIGKGKLKTGLMSSLQNVAKKAPDFVANMINPTNVAVGAVLEVVGGTQGHVSVHILPYGDYPPIIDPKAEKAPDWWRPLNDVFISPNFDVDAYNEFLIMAEEKQRELDANPLPPEDRPQSNLPTNDKSANTLRVDPKVKPSETPKAQDLARNDGDKGTVAPIEQVEKAVSDNPEIAKEAIQAIDAPPASGSEPLAANQRKTKMGRIVTLPDYAVERDCWTKFNKIGDEQCLLCPANLECMTEGAP